MKAGRGSRTAVMVCAWRAMAHGRTSLKEFSDPTAFELLPEDARARVEQFKATPASENSRGGLSRKFLEKRVQMMVARTVAVDRSVRESAAPQLVILGAGLDGRAWRMPELRDVVAFEVDHPDTQREKRERIGALTRHAREVHFVPVDFTRDRLDEALAAAGHDPRRPTTWVWEGVVMYLTPAQVEATLAIVARLSAPKSRLIVVYHSPAWLLHVIGLIVRGMGEPLRSTFTADAMRELLEKHGFEIVRDQGLPEIGRSLSDELGDATRYLKHTRIVSADRAIGKTR